VTLSEYQQEVQIWARRNFGDMGEFAAILKFLGVVEEVGELAHSMLKASQGIRGSATEHEAKAKDAVGDALIYLLDFCATKGWDCGAILEETWNQVKQRDWTKNKATGS
jgi:NTP pyrophosphatase (non-canonical NTP hydrolase)